MTLYQYDQLPQAPGSRAIRLLELQPAKPEEALRCRIRQVSLDENPSYQAVSYCWGPAKIVDRIFCDDNAYLPLSESLSSALRRFRHHLEPTVLWTDAICINQLDNDEKGKQVNMMREVYRQARQVLVWLGEEAEGERLQPLVKLTEKLATIDMSALSEDRMVKQRSLGFHEEHILSLSSLLSRPWFRRVWIIQEVAVAADAILHVGQLSLNWKDLCFILQLETGINLIGVNNSAGMDAVDAIELERVSLSKGAPVSLLQAILRHRLSLATDDRDKVYALLGLCTDRFLCADYNLSTRELYRLVAKEYMLRENSLNIITAPNNPVARRDPLMPSWVPDWSETDVAFPFSLRAQLLLNVPEYQAAGQSRWTPAFSADGAMLGVEAQFLGEVVVLGLIRHPYRPSAENHMKSLFKQLRNECIVSHCWQKICLGDASSWKDIYDPTGESVFDASWQILLAGCSPSEWDECRTQSKKIWKMFRKYLLLSRMHLLPLSAFGWMDSLARFIGKTIFIQRILAAALANDFQFRVRRTITHRRMMRTDKGYLGLVPALAQTGDRIVLLKGLNVPALVRSKGETWELVGDCYVHGMMNGEAFRSERCEHIWLA